MNPVQQTDVGTKMKNPHRKLRKILEEKQYENMSFTVDDLLIFQDHQQVKYLTNPSEYLNLVSNWIMLDKKSKQRIDIVIDEISRITKYKVSIEINYE